MNKECEVQMSSHSVTNQGTYAVNANVIDSLSWNHLMPIPNEWKSHLINALSPVLECIISVFVSSRLKIRGEQKRRRTVVCSSCQTIWQSSPSQQTALPHPHSNEAGIAVAGMPSPALPQKSSMASWTRGPSWPPGR